MLGDDRLVVGELEPLLADGNRLRARADKPHFNAAQFLVVHGAVLELAQVEVCAKVAIDAAEHVEIELRSNAAGIVIRGFDHADLLQIDADEQPAAGSAHRGQVDEHRLRFVRREISDCRAWKEHGAVRGRAAETGRRNGLVKSAHTGNISIRG